VLLAPLPVDHPEQLVVVSHSSLAQSGGVGFPYLFFRELDGERQLLDGVMSRGGSERVTLGSGIRVSDAPQSARSRRGRERRRRSTLRAPIVARRILRVIAAASY
jgi:hypothetical protein